MALVPEGTKPLPMLTYNRMCSCGIHLRAISPEIFMNLIVNMCWEHYTFKMTPASHGGQWVIENMTFPKATTDISRGLKFVVKIYSCIHTVIFVSWHHSGTLWRHQMETFSALLALCAGNSPVTGEFPSQRPVTRSFEVFFDLRLNKRMSKQSRRRWLETPSRSLWRHRNDFSKVNYDVSQYHYIYQTLSLQISQEHLLYQWRYL